MRGSAMAGRVLGTSRPTPDGTAMPQANIIGIEWFRDDDVVGMIARDISSFDEQTRTGIAIARTLLVNDAALFNGALQM